DNAMHTTQVADPDDPRPVATTRVISYQGVLQQALRHLVDWVERGIAPPKSTNYSVEDSQIVVPPSASERCGLQPVCTLTANGSDRVEVKVGETVRFEAVAQVPPGAGRILSAHWDFEGAGDYPVSSNI